MPLSVPKSPTPVVGAAADAGAVDDEVCPPVGVCDERPQPPRTMVVATVINANDVDTRLRP
jgi:hypothetical protein